MARYSPDPPRSQRPLLLHGCALSPGRSEFRSLETLAGQVGPVNPAATGPLRGAFTRNAIQLAHLGRGISVAALLHNAVGAQGEHALVGNALAYLELALAACQVQARGRVGIPQRGG